MRSTNFKESFNYITEYGATQNNTSGYTREFDMFLTKLEDRRLYIDGFELGIEMNKEKYSVTILAPILVKEIYCLVVGLEELLDEGEFRYSSGFVKFKFSISHQKTNDLYMVNIYKIDTGEIDNRFYLTKDSILNILEFLKHEVLPFAVAYNADYSIDNALTNVRNFKQKFRNSVVKLIILSVLTILSFISAFGNNELPIYGAAGLLVLFILTSLIKTK